MSRLVSRILLSIFLFPLAAVFYGLTAIVMLEWLFRSSGPNGEVIGFLLTTFIIWGLMATYWILLWRGSVNWTRGRIGGTVLLVVGATFLGTIAGAIATSLMPGAGNAGFGVFIGGILAIMLWMIGTVFVWRETAEERARRIDSSAADAVTCPACGYNMTGLSEPRCPECGSKYTLNELFAGQASRVPEME